MRNLVILSQEEIIKRAKTLYFDKYPALDTIFVDHFGRFDTKTPDSLIEQGRVYNVQVFQLKRADLYAKPKKDDK